MRIACALLLLLAAGCARAADSPPPSLGKVSAEIADRGPRLIGRPPAVAIELPPRMTRALAGENRGFTTLAPGDFEPDIVPGKPGWAYPYDARQAPFAVVADFDGDGRTDVALLQRSGDAASDSGRAVAVFDDASTPRLVELRRWRNGDAGESRRTAFYLARSPAGRRELADFNGGGGATSVTLAHEGITVANYGKAAQTFYWHEGRFEHLQTAD